MLTGRVLRSGLQMAAVVAGLALAPSSWAAFGEDIEKPKPEFTRQDEQVTARLIPRGKSTSVQIQFAVKGGTLTAVEGAALDTAGQGGIDPKDFRSDMFALRVDELQPGGDATVSVSSAYFTAATELWARSRAQSDWVNTGAQNLDRPERVQELMLSVRDGGPLDTDGVADGKIRLVIGPRDSFWGYALGTLLIRFFGIFLVLGVLMVGMIAAGFTFQWVERRRSGPRTSVPLEPSIEAPADGPGTVPPEAAAAIALALHLHLSRQKVEEDIHLEGSDGSSWARQGRSQIMRDRLSVQDRLGRK